MAQPQTLHSLSQERMLSFGQVSLQVDETVWRWEGEEVRVRFSVSVKGEAGNVDGVSARLGVRTIWLKRIFQ